MFPLIEPRASVLAAVDTYTQIHIEKTHKVYKSYSHARFPQDARGDSEQTPCFTGPTIQKHSNNEDGNPNFDRMESQDVCHFG